MLVPLPLGTNTKTCLACLDCSLKHTSSGSGWYTWWLVYLQVRIRQTYIHFILFQAISQGTKCIIWTPRIGMLPSVCCCCQATKLPAKRRVLQLVSQASQSPQPKFNSMHNHSNNIIFTYKNFQTAVNGVNDQPHYEHHQQLQCVWYIGLHVQKYYYYMIMQVCSPCSS